MREVIEHFGIGLLETVGCMGIINIIIKFWNDNGVMKIMIWNYLNGLSS